MPDYAQKRAAAQERLAKLAQDKERIAAKIAQAEALVAECDRMLAEGKTPEAEKSA